MVKIMNKKGLTILEVLISISIVSIVILLLIKVMFSLDNINNDKSYASSDEIKRTEIIKNIESDFLELKLNGININEGEYTTITFKYLNEDKALKVYDDKIIYDNITHTLNSENAAYSKCIEYNYIDLENNYYLITLNIPVLIGNENTTTNDDLTLTYLGLKNENTNYLTSFSCSKK
ncbi:MAG: prepilin-type N-terminal cleavage/methylation domain-containing protein [Firmicutes bacterium]|nr:prepilin-type N-terminal cleavage/methylation domain-containing protein [Bacillota bacterium]